jgi:hypothetical protein
VSDTQLGQFRWFNLIASSLGAIVFGALFLLVQFAPGDLDVKMRDYAVDRVQQKLETRLQSDEVDSVLSTAESLAGRLSSGFEERIANARLALEIGLPEFVGNVVSQVCEGDCERGAEVEANIRAFYEAQIERYGIRIEQLRAFIAGEYAEIVNALKSELKIFSGSTFVVMLSAALIAAFRGKAAAHLLPVSALLLVSTGLAISWYIFGQNWFMAVLFSDYWGWSYAVFLGIIISLLADIVLLKARVTTFLLNGLSGVNLSIC